MLYEISFTKNFLSGNLEGLTYNDTMYSSFPNNMKEGETYKDINGNKVQITNLTVKKVK